MRAPEPVTRLTQRWRVRSRRPASSRVLIAVGVLGLLAGLLGFLAHYWTATSTVRLGLSAVSPYLMLGALGAVVMFGFARGRSGSLGLALSVALVVWSAVVQARLYVAATAPPGRDVVVLTSNLRLGQADAESVVAAVRAHHVEVLMLEELTIHEVTALRAAGLDRLLPHSFADPHTAGGAGTGLWSRYPLTNASVRSDFGFSMVVARVAVPAQTPAPTVVALHMYGPSPQPQFSGWVHDLRHLPAVLQALPRDAPVLAAGDYNATTDVAQFRRLLRGGFADATDQAGGGYLPTYPADRFIPPVIAIDHVLTRGAVGRRAETIGVSGSDHRALLVTVRLPSAQ